MIKHITDEQLLSAAATAHRSVCGPVAGQAVNDRNVMQMREQLGAVPTRAGILLYLRGAMDLMNTVRGSGHGVAASTTVTGMVTIFAAAHQLLQALEQ